MQNQLDDPVSQTLLQVSSLIQTSILKLVEARREASVTNTSQNAHSDAALPSWDIFNAQKTLLAACGTITEFASDPKTRLLEVSSQYFEARALHIAADARIADALAERTEAGKGLHIDQLANQAGLEPRKLSRIMRCLCSIHIFRELEPNVFANNAVSESLVHNEPLRAYIILFALDIYTSSDHLPKYLYGEKGSSYAVDQSPWQDALGTTKSRWDWLDEKTTVFQVKTGSQPPGTSKCSYPGVFGWERLNALQASNIDENMSIRRPEHAIFSLAMIGGGQVTGVAHLYDFPWASLGSATVVDVGGGVGGFCLQLSQIYPNLKFILQDRQNAIDKARNEVWPCENPAALDGDRIQFMVHDFFKANPVRGAHIYWLRYILHDWSDEYCIRILEAIKSSMEPHSRILICDQVMNTTLGSQDLPSAPAPLLANWGFFGRYSHQRDLAMMAIINGIERSPRDFNALASGAGLALRRIWDCRSQVGLVELVLPDAELQ